MYTNLLQINVHNPLGNQIPKFSVKVSSYIIWIDICILFSETTLINNLRVDKFDSIIAIYTPIEFLFVW